MKPRDLAYCGVFGAAALLLPPLFHLLHLGSLFLPMFHPLLVLAFLAAPGPVAGTAVLVPLLSGALTGMPPFWPPIAPLMSAELGVTCGAIALVRRRWPRANEWAVLVPSLALGRAVWIGLVYAFGRVVDLPAAFLAGISFLAGWPGMILAISVVPLAVRAIGSVHATAEAEE